MKEKRDIVETLLRGGYSHRQIRDIAGVSVGYVSSVRNKMNHKVVGVFSDPHIPFNHPNYLRFVLDTFKKFSVTDVVCGGDLVDHHAISRHLTETDAWSSSVEFERAYAEVQKYVNAFSEFDSVSVCLGNHDLIPQRQAATLGIGENYIKSFSELWNLPKNWSVDESHIIDNVLYTHGINAGGKDGAINKATLERMSTVIGHYHSYGGVKYVANPRSIIFGMNVGCGIDVKAYAFAYGKHAKYRPTLGCGIVKSSAEAYFVPMGAEYFRN